MLREERSYFYDDPSYGTVRSSYIIKGNRGLCSDGDGDFIFITYERKGRVTKGWMIMDDFYVDHQVKNQTVLPEPEPFYIINTMACRKENDAVNATQKLINEGYRAGYLWIPDYNSLSGKEYYTVYLGPFYSQYECEVEVEKYRRIQPTAYGLIVNQENKRIKITGVGKVKVTYY